MYGFPASACGRPWRLAATVVVGALIGARVRGWPPSPTLAAVGAATMPALLGADHLGDRHRSTILAWAALALVVVRVGRTGNRRAWLVGGLVLGVGLTNKHSVGFFAVAIFAGALLSGGWRPVVNRWFLAGAAIAAAFHASRSVVAGAARLADDRHDPEPQPGERWRRQRWQLGRRPVDHGQPGPGVGLDRWPDRLSVAVGAAVVAGAGVGLRRCCSCSSPSPPAPRSTTWAAPTCTCWRRAAWASRPGWQPGRGNGGACMILTTVTTALALPLVLPVLPPQDIAWTYKVNQVPGRVGRLARARAHRGIGVELVAA